MPIQQPPQRPTQPVVQPEAAETPGAPVAKQEQAKPEEPKPAAGADAIVEEEVDDKMAKEEKQGSSVQDKMHQRIIKEMAVVRNLQDKLLTSVLLVITSSPGHAYH